MKATIMQTAKPMSLIRNLAVAMTVAVIAMSWSFQASASKTSAVSDAVKRTAELKIRNLLDPLFDKYCHDECRLMAVTAEVDISTPDEVAPGFDDVDPKSVTEVAASAAKVKILIDDKVGQVSRGKLLELVQQYLDTLDFPVRIETQIAHLPQPISSATKVAELRERIGKQFKSTVDDLFKQFCPDQCMLADYQLSTELVNPEEAQYGSSGEFVQDGTVALRVSNVSGTILIDESVPADVRANVLEMAKFKTNFFKNVSLASKSMRFPRPIPPMDQILNGQGNAGRSLASTSNSNSTNSSNSTNKNVESMSNNSNSSNHSNNQSNTSETNARQERFERIEKIERVESGDAVQAELQKFKVYGLVFACSIISLLIFLALATMRSRSSSPSTSVQRIVQSLASDPVSANAPSTYTASESNLPVADERSAMVARRYEIERLHDELMAVFAQQPKVAKEVFSRILTEEGVEVTAQYIHLFSESVVIDMIRDPSLQGDVNELMEFYAKNTFELTDEEKLELLRKLHNRTVAGKLVVMGSRSSHLFDYLADMDGMQILELIRNESLTVKSIALTQCDSQKRQAIFAQLDDDSRMKLMAELSRIDYLPRDYISNVANALKRKRSENPKLNTEALPGSEVLVTLLERTGASMQRSVIKNLEMTNPDSARAIKNKLVSLDTLRHLRDGQLLEVILSLRHDELIVFLKGTPEDIRNSIYGKSPKDLVAELEEELVNVTNLSREVYQAVERKIINRMKLMANEGLINLVETNDRMLNEIGNGTGFVEAGPADPKTKTNNFQKVAGW